MRLAMPAQELALLWLGRTGSAIEPGFFGPQQHEQQECDHGSLHSHGSGTGDARSGAAVRCPLADRTCATRQRRVAAVDERHVLKTRPAWAVSRQWSSIRQGGIVDRVCIGRPAKARVESGGRRS